MVDSAPHGAATSRVISSTGLRKRPDKLDLDYRTSIYRSSMSRPAKPLPAASMHLVLALLAGEMHGYALMRRVQELRTVPFGWARARCTAHSTGWSMTA